MFEKEFAQQPRDAVVVTLVVCRVLDVQGGSRQVLGVAVVGEIAGKCRVCRVQANAAQGRAERWSEAKSDSWKAGSEGREMRWYRGVKKA